MARVICSQITIHVEYRALAVTWVGQRHKPASLLRNPVTAELIFIPTSVESQVLKHPVIMVKMENQVVL